MMAGSGTGGATGVIGGPARHIPVMLAEVLHVLRPRDGGRYIDGTFGGGGYTRAILEAAETAVLAIDRDPQAISGGSELQARWGARLKLVEGNFADLADIAETQNFAPVDGVVFDVGVSSMQLDQSERGFSFLRDGPLDMRMEHTGPSAADVVNNLPENELVAILKVLGEERRARAIARAIVKERAEQRISQTVELADIVTRVLGPQREKDKHPATRTFQALRIYVNGELQALAQGLAAAERVLCPGGRLVVVSFHSLEDRIVKRFLKLRSGRVSRASRHFPEEMTRFETPSFQIVNPRHLGSSNEEARVNPRARSAKLRAGERTEGLQHEFDALELGVPSLNARGLDDLG